MRILAIYGSPRKDGNTDLLLDAFLEGASESALVTIERLYVRELQILPCNACGECLTSDKCPIMDDMSKVYKAILKADVLVVATPVYFYNVPAGLKALIDRCQLLWHQKIDSKKPGYLMAVGGSQGQRLFEGLELTIKYFFKSCGFKLVKRLLYRGVDAKGAIKSHPLALKEAYEAGNDLCLKLLS